MVALGCRSVKLDYKALAHWAVVMRTTGFKEKPQLSLSHPSNQPRVCQCEQPMAVPSWDDHRNKPPGLTQLHVHRAVRHTSAAMHQTWTMLLVFLKRPHTYSWKNLLERSEHNQFGASINASTVSRCGFLTYGQTGQKQAYLNYFCLRNYVSQLNYGLSAHLARILLTWNSLCVGALVFKYAQGQW